MPTADEMLGRQVVHNLTQMIVTAAPGKACEQMATAPEQVVGLPMRQRVDVVVSALLHDLGTEHTELVSVLRRAASDHPSDFSGWLIWPVTEAAAQSAVTHGTDEAFHDALDFLAELTHRFTSEFALRILLRHNVEAALRTITTWTASEDHHVRRLASEGTRLFLPWGLRVSQLNEIPASTLPILNALYNDPSEYVRRSVANHLNDLSRDHADLVLHTARAWANSPGAHTQRTIKHALRTLIKRGNPEALELIGFTPVEVEVHGPFVDRPTIEWGGSVQLRASLHNSGAATARVLIDYVMHYCKANGTTSPKVFKWTTVELAPGETVELEREHSFRPISTRTYHAGTHAVSVQVNGVAYPAAEFELMARLS